VYDVCPTTNTNQQSATSVQFQVFATRYFCQGHTEFLTYVLYMTIPGYVILDSQAKKFCVISTCYNSTKISHISNTPNFCSKIYIISFYYIKTKN
jgi:hypothetical protein